MSLLSRLFFSGRTPVTAQQLGDACARQALRAALEGDDALVLRIERIGLPVRERDEVALFALVPFDCVIADEYGGAAEPVRAAMCESAADRLRELGHGGAALAPRLERYTRVLRQAPPGEGPQLLGEHAYAAIARRAAPAPNGAQLYLDATLLLAEFFLAARVQTLEGLQRFTLIRGG